MKFSLMLFASSEDALAGDKYHLVIESAGFGDRHGFSSIWVPERHFTRFGALYPNPAVLHAALAMTTRRIRLNAGSVVTPLHNPIRIAEDWAVVDNLSGGRIGISFASGWNPDDFAFFPDRYANRHEEMYKGIALVQRLWRGETLRITSGNGKESEIRIFPTPIQKELPICLTAAGNPKTYQAAGQIGANLLTHILDQDIEQLAKKIALYRDARAGAGFDPATGQVTLMLHTLVGADAELVREQARGPYCEYLKANVGLLSGVAQSRGRNSDAAHLSGSDLDEFVNYLYDRFASTRGLIGTPESCQELVRQCASVGVDEIACLLDFGPEKQLILNYLPNLSRLKTLCEAQQNKGRPSQKDRSKISIEEIKARCAEELSDEQFSALMKAHGVQISSTIRFVERVWRRDGEALGRLSLPRQYTGDDRYRIHPAALDACSRVLAAALPRCVLDGPQPDLYLPTGFEALRMHKPPAGELWSHAIMQSPPNGDLSELSGDVSVYDASGSLLLAIKRLKLKRADARPRVSLWTDITELREGKRPFDRLLYRRVWKPIIKSLSASQEYGEDRGSGEGWLIFADQQGIGASLAETLERRGDHCCLVDRSSSGKHNQVPIADALRSNPEIRNIIHLWSVDATPSETMTIDTLQADQERAVRSILDLTQALATAAKEQRVRTYFVTRGAMPIHPGKNRLSIGQTPVWGFAMAVAVEHPNLWGGLIDLDPEASIDTAVETLLQALTRHRGEDMIGIRAGAHYAARLELQDLPAQESVLRFSGDASYLITGGLGGLGRRLALWMADRGARHLCLASRDASEHRAPAFLNKLNTRGVETLILRADVASEPHVSRVVARIAESMPPLRGVFHLAGVLDDALLMNETWDRVKKVGAAKMEGAWNLHQATADLPLDHFVMFSSAASLLVGSGQANYAMANSFLDALAHHRRTLGLPALSVNWGPWAEAGHVETDYGREAHAKLRLMGLQPILPAEGLDLLGVLATGDFTQIAAIDIDWEQLFQRDPAVARLAIVREIARQSATASAVRKESDTELLRSLRELPASERRGFLMHFLSQQITRTLKLDVGFSLEPRQQLFDLGFDSIMAIELKTRLEQSLGRSFSATLLFMHPTLESLTEYLLSEAVGLTVNRTAIQRANSSNKMPNGTTLNGETPNLEAISEEQMVHLLLNEIKAVRQ